MERSAWSAQNALLIRLFPQYFSSVPLPRYSVNDVFWMELGELIPQPAWKAIKNQQNDSSTIRWLVAGALTAKHPDGQELFQQAVAHELHSMDSQYSRLSSVSSRSSLVIPWVLAAKRHSPQLGKQACWLLAHDYLSGRLEPSSTSVLPTTQRLDNQALAIALCIDSEFPELAQMIVDRCVPKVLEQLEQDMAQPYARSLDASLVAYFAPQQTTELIKRVEQQNVNAAPANGLPSARLISLAQMRQSCLRGLLLDAEQLLGAYERR
ncbi:MAG: hypothetical protein IT423_05010 [Pirellulaceae bacterium]|nr:hypothetical protein [Pirellulaceae bacterium]